ncbi:MAG: MerR family DNA-binding transcriptional regulator, partial [bacterium]
MQNEKLITIGEMSNILGISIQTLRRWDKEGKLSSIRKTKSGNRYYNKDIADNFIKNNMKDIFKFAKSWALNDFGIEPPSDFYCQNSFIFQARLSRFEKILEMEKRLKKIFPLITAITGEIGNNSFDHNLGNWQDIPGVFFSYDLDKKNVILADRGQGILKTLKKVKPELTNDQDALKVAFTEIISGRAPEARGNGLKFVKNVVGGNKMSLLFQTGEGQLEIKKDGDGLEIKKSDNFIHG